MAKTPKPSNTWRQGLLRWLLLVLTAWFALELFFAGRIALMRWVARRGLWNLFESAFILVALPWPVNPAAQHRGDRGCR